MPAGCCRELNGQASRARSSRCRGDASPTPSSRRWRRSRSRPSSRGDDVRRRQAAPRAVPPRRRRAGRRPRAVRGHRGLPDRRARRPTAAGCVVVAVPNMVADRRRRPGHAIVVRQTSRTSPVDDLAAYIGRRRRRRRRRTAPTAVAADRRRDPVAARRGRASTIGGGRRSPPSRLADRHRGRPPSSAAAATTLRRRRVARRAQRPRLGAVLGPRRRACRDLATHADTIHEVSPFWYRGDRRRHRSRSRPTRRPSRPTQFLDTAREHDVPLVASILDGTDAGVMAGDPRRPRPAGRATSRPSPRSPPTATSPASTSTTSSSRSPTAEDSWATTRPNWVAVHRGARPSGCDADGRTLAVSIPPVYDTGQTDDSGYWVYDYAAIAPLVDTIRVMAYDYSVSSGRPRSDRPADVGRPGASPARSEAAGRPVEARAGHPAVRLQLGRRHDGHVPDDGRGQHQPVARATSRTSSSGAAATPVFDADDAASGRSRTT